MGKDSLFQRAIQIPYKESIILTQIFFTQQSMNEISSAIHGHVTHCLRVEIKKFIKTSNPKGKQFFHGRRQTSIAYQPLYG